MKFGAVAIGRNEGERLKRCLRRCPRPQPSSTSIPARPMGRRNGRATMARKWSSST